MADIQRINPMTVSERVNHIVQQLIQLSVDNSANILALKCMAVFHGAHDATKALSKTFPSDVSQAIDHIADESVFIINMWLNASLVGLDPLDGIELEKIDPLIRDLLERSTGAFRALLTSDAWPKGLDPRDFVDTFSHEQSYIGFIFIEAGTKLTENTRRQLSEIVQSPEGPEFIRSVQAIQNSPDMAMWQNFTKLTKISPLIPEDVLENKCAALRFVEAASALTKRQVKLLSTFSNESHERLATTLKGLAYKAPNRPNGEYATAQKLIKKFE